jgi:transglutaminase-like putative cysteine protease
MGTVDTTDTRNPHAVARYRIIHRTEYSYQIMVTLSQQYLHLTPRDFRYQHTLTHRIDIDPLQDEQLARQDYFGNSTLHVTLTTPHQSLRVNVESTVELYARPTPADIAVSAAWENLQQQIRQPQRILPPETMQTLYNSPHIACSNTLRDYALQSFTPNRPLLEAALDLTQRIHRDFEFDSNATDISTPLDQVWAGRRGVCQDFAHWMIGCLRSIGLPARYVSGYILTHPQEGQPRLIGADASHAWVSVYSPEFGWVDFDPTNHCLVQHEHITLGWGRDFSDVSPLRGVVLGGGEQILGVSVTVAPVGEEASGLLAAKAGSTGMSTEMSTDISTGTHVSTSASDQRPPR